MRPKARNALAKRKLAMYCGLVITTFLICDDTKALSEWVVRGTPQDGHPFEYLGCDLWEFKNGLVSKKDTYWKFVG